MRTRVLVGWLRLDHAQMAMRVLVCVERVHVFVSMSSTRNRYTLECVLVCGLTTVHILCTEHVFFFSFPICLLRSWFRSQEFNM